MRIGIDISQIVHEGTGVGTYVRQMVRSLVAAGDAHEFVLFGASLRRRDQFETFVKGLPVDKSSVRLVTVPVPPTILDLMWNMLHIIPVEWFTGRLDVFWSSDWTQPPLAHATGVTTIHDLTIYRYPESFDKKIINTHIRRLNWARRECAMFLCDSQATASDVTSMLGIPSSKVRVMYPGFSA